MGASTSTTTPSSARSARSRLNALLAGSDEGGDNWVFVATLIECCKLNGLGPPAWLTNTLARLANGHPANAVGEPMPWIAVG
jgi:hypothetical protein